MSTSSPRSFFLPGLLLLLVAWGASFALSLDHLGAAKLAGCGLDSGCARALTSRLGHVGAWPTAFLGLAFFTGLVVSWVATAGRTNTAMAWVSRLGAVGSLLFLGEMLRGGYLCPYCLGVHAANLCFWGLGERRPTRKVRALPFFAVGFLLATAGLYLAQRLADQEDLEAEEREQGELAANPPLESSAQRFRGRYVHGPESAKVRLVVFSDFECEDCKRVDQEISRLLETRDDLSLSIKHFPIAVACNEKARTQKRDLHPNACRAARAVEAAGKLGGEPGFRRMHEWLFEVDGRFGQAQLDEAISRLGFERQPFLAAMASPEIEAWLQEDIREGIDLGLSSTPMIFINGRVFENWQRPGALTRAVETVGARAPQADAVPMSGAERSIADWRKRPRARLAHPGRGKGPEGDELEVVIWGDYFDPNTRELDERMRRAVRASGGRARYSFRYFPLESSCNPGLPRTLQRGGCLAARGAEAAHQSGGVAAFEAVHEMLMGFEGRLTQEELLQRAGELGLPPHYRLTLSSASVQDAVRKDIENARRMKIHSVPLLFIDGRQVARWKDEGTPVPETILREALGN